MVRMSAEDLHDFLQEQFPQALESGLELTEVSAEGLTVAMTTQERHLRPGNTVSGPTLMTLADAGTYLAILARLGPVALALTSSLEIHFLARPRPGRLVGRVRLLKVGRQIVVAVVAISSGDKQVAHATVTYVLPSSAGAP